MHKFKEKLHKLITEYTENFIQEPSLKCLEHINIMLEVLKEIDKIKGYEKSESNGSVEQEKSKGMWG